MLRLSHYQHDPVSVRVVLVDQFLYHNHMRPVHLRATLSDLDSRHPSNGANSMNRLLTPLRSYS